MENGKLICSCKESTFEGLPCRHELCVYVKGSKPITSLHFQNRWAYEYFDVKSLPAIESDIEGLSNAREEQEEALRHSNEIELIPPNISQGIIDSNLIQQNGGINENGVFAVRVARRYNEIELARPQGNAFIQSNEDGVRPARGGNEVNEVTPPP